jgi:hypothetical protein
MSEVLLLEQLTFLEIELYVGLNIHSLLTVDPHYTTSLIISPNVITYFILFKFL